MNIPTQAKAGLEWATAGKRNKQEDATGKQHDREGHDFKSCQTGTVLRGFSR